ncbi:MAG: hypothetical protein FJ147_08975 [Deltaproteobacteria bacterium]|nr:hypothetical protein [Deltaproteobacteria bacterium]
MSVAYFIVLDNENPGFDTFVNGKSLAKEAQSLSAICERLGLPRFDDFLSVDPGEWDEEGADDPGAFSHSWYSADEGLSLVTALRDYITQHPTTVKKAKSVLADLSEYVEVFAAAKKIGAKWHLEIDL